MKRILLATTAIAGLAAFAQPATAQEFTVELSGSVNFEFGWFDEDSLAEEAGGLNNARASTAEEADIAVNTDYDFIINADAVADNGLEFGLELDFDAAGTDLDTDEAWLYVSGTFGEVRLGDNDGADTLAVFFPTVGIGQLDGSAGDYLDEANLGSLTANLGNAQTIRAADTDATNDIVSRTDFSTNLVNLINNGTLTTGQADVAIAGRLNVIQSNVNYIEPFNTGDDTKLVYFTPDFMGFQAGVSYQPNFGQGSEQGNATLTQLNEQSVDDDYEDIFGFGLTYDGEFNGVGVQVGFNGSYADAVDEQRFGDLFSWQIGAIFSYAGFSLGGVYGQTDEDDFTASDWNAAASIDGAEIDKWAVAATYEQGPVGVGIGYGEHQGSIGGNDVADEWQISVGGSYQIANGLEIRADYYHTETEITPLNSRGDVEVDGDAFVTSVRVRF